MKWNKIEDTTKTPQQCELVLLRGNYEGGKVIVPATLIEDKFVTDATIAEVYGAKEHADLIGFIPEEWTHI